MHIVFACGCVINVSSLVAIFTINMEYFLVIDAEIYIQSSIKL